MPYNRTVDEINQKIIQDKAKILTAYEISQKLNQSEEIKFEDVDVVTTATKGIMSGTSAILGFRISDPKVFTKLKKITLNGINAFPGPAPNETLGVVDLTVYGTNHSETNPHYGGGHLFRDLVERKPIKIHAISAENIEIKTEINLDEMSFAQLLGTRHAFRNYNSFINLGKKPIKSIFSVHGMAPNKEETSFCGVGSFNPIENDPSLQTMGIGTPILVNGAVGSILSHGTRSSADRPNLMTIAPLKKMDPKFMGGFQTSNGPEVICSVAAAIPVLNDSLFQDIIKTDNNIKLNIVDILGRSVIDHTTYADAWDSTPVIGFQTGHCETCELKNHCPIVEKCPTLCFSIENGMDKSKCFNCGVCLSLCPHNAFIGNLGSINFQNCEIPITLRQSDRQGAIDLMKLLKKNILEKNFKLREPNAPIEH